MQCDDWAPAAATHRLHDGRVECAALQWRARLCLAARGAQAGSEGEEDLAGPVVRRRTNTGEAEAHAGRFRRKKRIKNPEQVRLGNTAAGVVDFDHGDGVADAQAIPAADAGV